MVLFNMKWNKLYNYPKSVREMIAGKRHYVLESGKLPSVTTILSATQSDEKRASLQRWMDRVGKTEAERVKNTAATRGTAMHKYLEYYVEGQGLLDLTDVGVEAEKMAKTVIDKGMGDIEEIWGSEVVLSYKNRYAGASDLVGVYMGRESIMDFKQTNKPKKDEWIDDYYLQMAAYALAHNDTYGTDIDQGVILMCTPDCFFQRFLINGARFREYTDKWKRKVEQYYEQIQTKQDS